MRLGLRIRWQRTSHVIGTARQSLRWGTENAVKTDSEARSAPFSPRQNLTATEKEILELLAQGWTARETAGHVNLGIRTVERYIENLRLKMNARNTAHLIACAFSKGTLKVVRGVVKITN